MGMKIRSFFPSNQTGLLAGLAVAALLAASPALKAQEPATASPVDQNAPATQTTPTTTAPPAQADVTLSNTPVKKKKPKIAKAERVQETKDTKA